MVRTGSYDVAVIDAAPTGFRSPERYRTLVFAALVSLAAIIVTGAAVRLTGSGLGCTDWPTCEEGQLVSEFSFHPVIEFGNRVVTGFVALAVVIAVLGSLARIPRRRDLTWLSVGLVVGVIAQIVLGAVVTKTELDPRIVGGHFLVSMVLLWNAVVLHHRAGLPDDPTMRSSVGEGSLRRASAVMALAATVVLVVGTFVTGSGPHSGSTDEVLPNGETVAVPVERLPFALQDITRIHSAMVWVLLAATIATMYLLVRQNIGGDHQRRGQRVLAIIVAQGAVGYLQYALDVPVGLVGLHIVGAVALWWSVVSFRHNLLTSPVDASTRQPEGRQETNATP